MHAGFDDLARTYLPSVAEAAQIEDEAVRDEMLKFLASQEELDRFQQSRIARLWVEQAKVLTDAGLGQRQTPASGRSAGGPAGQGPGRVVRAVDPRTCAAGPGCRLEPGRRVGQAGGRQDRRRGCRPADQPPGRSEDAAAVRRRENRSVESSLGQAWRWPWRMGGFPRRSIPSMSIRVTGPRPGTNRTSSRANCWRRRPTAAGPRRCRPRCARGSTFACPRPCWSATDTRTPPS